jgi:hypothetical protein
VEPILRRWRADGEVPEEKIAEEVEEKTNAAERQPSVIVKTRSVGPREFQIRKEDAEKHGYTRGCPGCSSWFRGLARQPHTEKCRSRFGELMKEDARVKNALKRKEKFDEKVAQRQERKEQKRLKSWRSTWRRIIKRRMESDERKEERKNCRWKNQILERCAEERWRARGEVRRIMIFPRPGMLEGQRGVAKTLKSSKRRAVGRMFVVSDLISLVIWRCAKDGLTLKTARKTSSLTGRRRWLATKMMKP